jgi:hypothetical protein
LSLKTFSPLKFVANFFLCSFYPLNFRYHPPHYQLSGEFCNFWERNMNIRCSDWESLYVSVKIIGKALVEAQKRKSFPPQTDEIQHFSCCCVVRQPYVALRFSMNSECYRIAGRFISIMQRHLRELPNG